MVAHPNSASLGFTVSADLIRGVIDCAVRCGVPRSRLADLLHEDRAGTSAPARYAGGHILKLWDRILRETGDPIIGFRMALVAGTKTFGVLGQILPRCATVLESFRQTERYLSLASQAARLSVARSAEALTASVAVSHVPPGDMSRAILLWGLTNFSLLPQRLTETAVRPKGIVCAFPAPGRAAVRALNEHLPFEFDGEENRILFDPRVGEIGIPSADADLRALLAEVMDRHLAELGAAASFEQGMLALIRSMMNGNMPTLASLCAPSGMSKRTLQRRLGEANTSFQHLLKQVLHQEADALLAQGSLSQGEIAFLLGYSEESAFSRAYRSWTGHAPGAARL